MSREQFLDAKEQLPVPGQTDLQKAAKFYTLIKESFGSDLRSFGLRTKNLTMARDYLHEVSDRLNTVVIEHLDFERLIKNFRRAPDDSKGVVRFNRD